VNVKLHAAVPLATFLLLVAGIAQAALVDRGEGFIYDDVLDITWTQNANINFRRNWDEAVAWADGYSQTHSVYGTFDDWRLADMDVNGDGTIVNCSSASEALCQDNEYGYLYYQYGITSSTPGLFTNFQDGFYWSGTEYGPLVPNGRWGFDFYVGSQYATSKDYNYDYALAVRSGDVAAVPVPAAVWLLGSALAGLGWFRRRQTA